LQNENISVSVPL